MLEPILETETKNYDMGAYLNQSGISEASNKEYLSLKYTIQNKEFPIHQMVKSYLSTKREEDIKSSFFGVLAEFELGYMVVN